MGVAWSGRRRSSGSAKWACAICLDRLGLLERLADVRICADCQTEFPIIPFSARTGLPPTGSRGARVVAANGSAAATTRPFDPGPEVHAASVTAPASGPRSCP